MPYLYLIYALYSTRTREFEINPAKARRMSNIYDLCKLYVLQYT